MTEINNGKYVTTKFCEERHKGVERLEKRVDSMDRKLWGILILLVANLAGIIGWLVKG